MPIIRRIGGQRSTPERSPVDSCTPALREAQAESTGKRQQSTHRSEDTTCSSPNSLQLIGAYAGSKAIQCLIDIPEDQSPLRPPNRASPGSTSIMYPTMCSKRASAQFWEDPLQA
ncbi:hypothetical protein UY3_17044 [Chelonia mydas]|uniref:Uncharacterized protein n=1 Tax=Chelonia mydas TaxID=8469 RepID=M7AN04_CHEMY|nr:hypothetical protein UY3_17044 [Chelonia mydas]